MKLKSEIEELKKLISKYVPKVLKFFYFFIILFNLKKSDQKVNDTSSSPTSNCDEAKQSKVEKVQQIYCKCLY